LIKTEGMWLGLRQEIGAMLRDSSLILHAGDVMLLYTDGITDAVSTQADRFSKSGLKNVFKQLGNQSPDDIKDGILKELAPYQKQDDITLIAVKRLKQQ
jgi:phosphoserine phosphatase RsbU/P